MDKIISKEGLEFRTYSPRAVCPMLALCAAAISVHANTESVTESLYAPQETQTAASAADESAAEEEHPVAIDLNELVVESERLYIDGNKVVGIPSKRDRNLSTDMESLLRNMDMPVLRTINGHIVSVSGNELTYFINGKPAREADIAMFWPQDVIRVEYMEDSDNPEFMGKFPAVNFIVKIYKTGGIVRSSVDQRIPNSGLYSAGAKIVNGAMTYLALVNGGYRRESLSEQESISTFSDVSYEGERYDRIVTDSRRTAYADKAENAGAAINAIYNGRTCWIYHTAGLSWNRNPGSWEENAMTAVPGIFPSESSSMSNSSRTLSPYVSGQYLWQPNSSTYWSLSWQYAYTDRNSADRYLITGLDPIDNGVDEKNHNLNASLSFDRVLSRKLTLTLSPSTKYGWFRSIYDGSYDGIQTQTRGETGVTGRLGWNPSDRFSASIRGGVSCFYQSVNSESFRRWYPVAALESRWTPADNNFMYGRLSYNHTPSSNSTSADIIQRQSELMWVQGVPGLKGQNDFRLFLTDTWIPTGWMSVSASVTGASTLNQQFTIYGVEPGYDGIVKTYADGANMIFWGGDLWSSLKIAGGRLTLTPQVEYRYMQASKDGDRINDIHNIRLRMSASWNIGNCILRAEYGGPQKILSYGGTVKTHYDPDLHVSFIWGNGNWFVQASCNQVLGRFITYRSVTSGAHYESVTTFRQHELALNLKATYTFGFGKRINPNVDIEVENTSSSSMLE